MPSILENGLIPTGGTVNRAPHDTTTLPTDTVGIVVTVTTAGPLAVTFWGDDTVVIYNLALGTHELRGNFKLVKTTGTTAVAAGAAGTQLVVQRFKPYAAAKH